ncbi:hypothetical protein N7492_009763 [Penicillium capsulatum]|uniref:DUF4246 domain-containing protein n=1 Tax=Penicillium capsulatum TaxID=69766 RepID=A0A9W9LFD9_9EURO|nr:hypothetical protein N7492_009763 [Penicillium capsulatum]KAJ6114155.1 hypothetical protein N7512_007600 [Penicillium capsulatum]
MSLWGVKVPSKREFRAGIQAQIDTDKDSGQSPNEDEDSDDDNEQEENLGDDEEDVDEDLYYKRLDEWRNSRPIIQTEPKGFKPEDFNPQDKVDLRQSFANTNLQSYLSLTETERAHLRHGHLLLRKQNITENTFACRQRKTSDFHDLNYPQERRSFLQQVYGFDPAVKSYIDTQVTQDFGSVICREVRLVTFPNTIQHCVSPFSLEDKLKPGYRKVLALFLVDPHRCIISSANVPPQREDWFAEGRRLRKKILLEKFPVKLQGWVEDLLGPVMTMQEAKAKRLALMKERRVVSGMCNGNFEVGSFNICEH